MALDQRKYEHKHEAILRDVRPLSMRIADALSSPSYSTAIFFMAGFSIHINAWMLTFADLILFFLFIYFLWLSSRDRTLAFKLPLGAKHKDKNNGRAGKPGNAEGILYLGNVEKTNEEVWFTNSDIRTHILYLGTTGAGKTEGLKSLVTNAMTWGSGFVYVDGKADTDLWSSLSSLVRRFGRDDDLLVLNYMTGNADVQAPSNTMNPFSSGSASYLTNMLVSLMPESGGDNAMWKERAVSLVGAMMPILTWKRDNQEVPMSVRTIREYLSLNNVIKLQRDEAVPAEVRAGLTGYLDTLPGFIADAYDDEGKVKPPGPDTPQYNTETASQQHGYLAMQFTRSLQSLGDDYGYIFDTQAADVDMVDVVLNRRILVVLVPALEKSGDEVANLGKIVSASIKGMMGSTLGSTVEGDSSSVIENKPTHSSTPFMTVFDEVGYYVAEGMAVMAAQARSLGFALVFAGQDLPAMKKRVREEAQSITANCNIKLFGKLEDPTETKDFFEKTVGSAMVTEVSGFQMSGGGELGAYHDTKQAGVQLRPRASYDGLRGFKEGQAVITFGETVCDCAVFYSNPGFAKAMRVTRFMSLPPPDETLIKHANAITKLRDLMVNKTWTAMRADVAVETSAEIAAMHDGFVNNNKPSVNPVDAGIAALVQIHAIANDIPPPSEAAQETAKGTAGGSSSGGSSGGSTGGAKPAAQAPQQAKSPVAAVAGAGAAAGGAKPSVFGGGAPAQPAQPQQPAQAKQEPSTPQEAALMKAAEDVKANVFGSDPKATPTTGSTPQTPPTDSGSGGGNAKPSIFGGAPAKPAQPEQPTTPPAAPEKPASQDEEALVKAAQEVKDNLFGNYKGSKDSGSDNAGGNAKPAIFGGAPAKPAQPTQPATPPAQEQPQQPQTPPTEQKSTTPQTPQEEALVKAAEEVKQNVFGDKQADGQGQTPPAAPEKPTESGKAKPAIFGGAPAQPTQPAQPTTPPAQEQPQQPPTPPAQETPQTPPRDTKAQAQQPQTPAAPEKPAESGNAKPAIFGGAPAQPAQPAQPTTPPAQEQPQQPPTPPAQETPQTPPAATEPPKEEKKDNGKPAIFGGGNTSKDDNGDDKQ